MTKSNKEIPVNLEKTMKTIKGFSLSSGIAKGVICVYSGDIDETLPHYGIEKENISAEIDRLSKAFDSAKNEMSDMIKIAETQLDKKAVDIFNTHLMILNDISLLKKTAALIENKLINAEHAVNDIFEEYIKKYQEQEGHFKELTHDFVDTRNRILSRFNLNVGGFKCEIGNTKPVLVAAKRLTPSMVLNISKEHILGFITEEGGVTSHATIIARSFGVPMVSGVNVEKELACSMEAVIDGSLGKVILWPDEMTNSYYEKKITNIEKKKNACSGHKNLIPQTKSGARINLKVNISLPQEMDFIDGMPYDGIGLLRTEFIFMQTDKVPSEDEQYAVYKNIFESEKQKPVTIRLLDIGSDKLPLFLKLPPNINPDMELRGAMAVETFPELYISQIKALLRANINSNMRILFPMVSDFNDIKTFKNVIQKAVHELKNEKKIFNDSFEQGIMIETPGAVMMLSELINEIDFVSIGSNDLLQYTLAAQRGNLMAEKRYHILHPALLKLIEIAALTGKKADKEVCLCGEIASFEEFYPLLLQAGVKSFSVAVSKFMDIKCELLHISKNQNKDGIKNFYKIRSKEEADKYIAEFM